MGKIYDVIIVGSGSMGSSAAYSLAKAGQNVLCLDRHHSPHVFGSHSGQSRIVRKAYFEHPDYVPLLSRSYEIWKLLEEEYGQKLFHQNGLLYLTPEQSAISAGVRHAADIHNLSIQRWDAEELFLKFPHFKSTYNKQILWEEEAGFTMPEQAIKVFLDLAEKNGAILQMPENVNSWKVSGGVCVVSTNAGTYFSDKLIFCPGASSALLLPDLKNYLKVSSQALAWFQIHPSAHFSKESFPCFMIDDEEYGLFYGFPQLKGEKWGGPVGLKLAHHHVSNYIENISDYSPEDRISNEEESLLRLILAKYLPEANGRLLHATTCLYTNSPDGDFILDFLPGHDEKVIIACGFSGHGFKFVPVVGEILCDLALTGSTTLKIDFLGLARLH